MAHGAIEVVIDGTNFGGKTPLVEVLVRRLRAEGRRVSCASPYREAEVYDLWDADPVAAATTICDIMRWHRLQAAESDIIVWDRGWPTCFVATSDPLARARFEPLPLLTFLLLNTAETTERKVQKYGLRVEAYPWMHRHRLKDEIPYTELAQEMAGRVTCFKPTLEDSRFDLELVAGEIVRAVLAERGG